MSASCRHSILVSIVVACAVWCLAGCSGGGGGNHDGFAFTAGTNAGDELAGNFWPTDVGRGWTYDAHVQVTGSGVFADADEDVTGTFDVNVQRTLDVQLDTGTVEASEFYVSPLDGGPGGDPGLAPAAATPAKTLLARIKQLVLRNLRVNGGVLRPKQLDLTEDAPDLSYFARIGTTRIEKVAVGYSDSGEPLPIASPRSYIPIPLVAQTPRVYGWERMFGAGGTANADALAEAMAQEGITGTISYMFGVAGLETITTPAGTFSAVRIHQYMTLDLSGQQGERASGTVSSLLWLADDIGDVQEELTLNLTASAPGEGSGTLTLTANGKLRDLGGGGGAVPNVGSVSGRVIALTNLVGLGNVLIEIKTQGAAPVTMGATPTDANGFFMVNALPPGTYTVVVTPDPGTGLVVPPDTPPVTVTVPAGGTVDLGQPIRLMDESDVPPTGPSAR